MQTKVLGAKAVYREKWLNVLLNQNIDAHQKRLLFQLLLPRKSTSKTERFGKQYHCATQKQVGFGYRGVKMTTKK
jgi:hypothetical protein